MTTRPLPPTPYRGPIISTRRPLPATPTPPPPPPSYIASASSSTVLQRRPHTRRLQTAPSSDLPSVSEEDESDLAEDDEPEPIIKSRRRPRPSPLIPSRSYAASRLPLILEIPDAPVTLQEQVTQTNEHESFALSPSTLLARRRSETILDFPLPPSISPPSHALSTPVTPPRHSPTPSHVSFSSTSTASSSPYPLTPHPSDDDDDELQSPSEKVDAYEVTLEAFEQALDARSPRPPRRSASVLSLRSFSTAEFDAQAEPIYALMHPPRHEPVAQPAQISRLEPVVQEVQATKEELLQLPTQVGGGRSPRLVLSVLDTTHGGSFDVPLVLGSFLSPPSSPCSLNGDGGESDGEGIPIAWSDSETEDGPLGSALSSSEDDASDGEGPSRALDPIFRSSRRHRRISRDGSRSPQLPPLNCLEPLDLEHDTPDTPSVYSVASPAEWNHNRLPPRESLVPYDVFSTRPYSTRPPSPRPSSPRPPSPLDPAAPQLRSRFSTSTLASIPEPPTSSSSKHAFFARLTGRKPPSPSKADRAPFSPRGDRPSFASNPARASLRRRAHVPASPAPSAFSFSTHSSSSRSSLDSADTCSCVSDESSGSTGLRRPPIPIELFLRG